MTLQEIKDAVNAGKIVHWASLAYTVVKGKCDNTGEDNWVILCTLNDHCIGLTWRDGVTMNGKPEQFFIADVVTEGK